jgi:hypothetical protein
VDAVRPESEPVRHLEQADLRATFRMWADNDRRLKREGMLGELTGLSKNLAALGTIGLQALEYVESGKPAPANWISEQKHALDEMEKPSAEVRLAAVRPVRLLLDAAGAGEKEVFRR